MQPYDIDTNDEYNDVEKEINLMGDDIEEDEEDETDENMEAPDKTTKEKKVQRFVFFDFETTQETVIGSNKLGPELKHVPNVCVAMITCDECRKRDFEFDCGRCGKHKHIFYGETCLDDFCKFLFRNEMKHTTAIAHNARGFDAQFIMQYLYKEGIKPKIITNGMQLL